MENLRTRHDHQLVIAVDYDDTFTAHKRLFSRFICDALKYGCKISFVTWRGEHENNEDMLEVANLLGIDVIFCNGSPKNEKIKADIWVDDNPYSITGRRK